MEALNLIRLFWGWGFPYISRIHTAYIGEYLYFRYLKCLVTKPICLKHMLVELDLKVRGGELKDDKNL